jgi:hypothetical protein
MIIWVLISYHHLLSGVKLPLFVHAFDTQAHCEGWRKQMQYEADAEKIDTTVVCEAAEVATQ